MKTTLLVVTIFNNGHINKDYREKEENYRENDAKLRESPLQIASKNDEVSVTASTETDDTQRRGDLLGRTNAAQTLSKAMFNAGCFSLPYAWKVGGLWISFAASSVIVGLNWYGNHILVRSSQHLAKKSKQPALDYGHFAKKLCDTSNFAFLRKHSQPLMWIVNVTILFYQLGMGSVAMLFIANNLVDLCGTSLGPTKHKQMIVACTIVLGRTLLTNLFTKMRVVSIFALVSTFFFLIGLVVILQEAIRQPNQIAHLPATGSFTNTMTMIGMLMYAFEGQTMILPVENKLKHPEQFLTWRFGVLPITMLICGFFMTAYYWIHYLCLFTVVDIFLMIQTLSGNAVALYVIFKMFSRGFNEAILNRLPKIPHFVVDKGFRVFWVLVTYGMSIGIPHLDIMIPLVGVTSGTLCALVYPPLFEIATFWEEWKATRTRRQMALNILLNLFLVCLGFFAIITGVYSNILAIIQAFSSPKGA